MKPFNLNPLFHPNYASFASPMNCKSLYEFGIVCDTPYKWKVVGTEAYLYTDLFDSEKIYAQALANEMWINSGIVLLPAFQIGELEKLMPKNYLVEKAGDLYIMRCVDKSLGIDDQFAARLPDTYAMMALQWLQRKYTKLKC